MTAEGEEQAEALADVLQDKGVARIGEISDFPVAMTVIVSMAT